MLSRFFKLSINETLNDLLSFRFPCHRTENIYFLRSTLDFVSFFNRLGAGLAASFQVVGRANKFICPWKSDDF